MIERLSDSRREAIENFQRRAPVKTIPIAGFFGIKVYSTDDWDNTVSGMIRRKSEGEDEYEIFVNGKHPLVRRRFTIAHEIAHFLLHRKFWKDEIVEDYLLRATGASAIWSNANIEWEANSLAADILMPMELIQSEYLKGARTIEGLAEKFEVSKDAMSIRLLGTHYRSPDRP